MRIILARHGEPDMVGFNSKNNKSYGEWLKKYNSSGIKKESNPPTELLTFAKKCDVIFSSNLKRAVDSVYKLDTGNKIITDKVFREFELPDNKKQYPKFTPDIWSVIFRILWFVGYSNKNENFADAKKRIKLSVEKLLNAAETNSDILLVGHGLMNKFIGMELKRTGWKRTGNKGRGYWSYSEYSKLSHKSVHL